MFDRDQIQRWRTKRFRCLQLSGVGELLSQAISLKTKMTGMKQTAKPAFADVPSCFLAFPQRTRARTHC
ncbi:hypothetical protein N7490_006259 [Penicillium lividum]|nr:hypothetical protein N7490_006259 [Penicillium lividum]